MQKMIFFTTPLIWGLIAAMGSMHAHCCDVNGTNSHQPIDTHGAADNEFVLGINISESSLHGDKQHLSTTPPSVHIPSLSYANSNTGKRSQSPLPALEDYGDKIRNDVLYEINKSNQEYSESHNRLTSSVEGVESADSSSSTESLPATSSTSSASASSSSSYFERVEWQESRAPAGSGSKDKLLLHRHKRYLLFPEGSSFQLVFDLIIPIVDYTNFAIMGITCAVAWELPSKPPSEIIDNLQQKLNDGTLGISRRNDSVQHQLEYINAAPAVPLSGEDASNMRRPHSQLSSAAVAASPAPAPPAVESTTTTSGLQQTPPKNTNMWQQPQISNPEQSSYRVASKDWSMARNPNIWQQTNPSTAWQGGSWWEHNKDRIQNQWQQNQRKWQTPSDTARYGRQRKLLTKRPKHRIYPVFGKRRRRSSIHSHPAHAAANDELTHKLNEIHLKHHLDTRHTLFGKIGKLYKSRGHNGTACVLRTICETQKLQRQRHRNQHPNTFVMELLRAIFNLPSDALAIKSLAPPYADAVSRAHEIESCGHHYDGCELPVWQNVQL